MEPCNALASDRDKELTMRHDFHGYTKEEAVREADSILFQVRKDLSEQSWTFVTGIGTIQDTLVKWCRDNELSFRQEHNNLGLLIVDIE